MPGPAVGAIFGGGESDSVDDAADPGLPNEFDRLSRKAIISMEQTKAIGHFGFGLEFRFTRKSVGRMI